MRDREIREWVAALTQSLGDPRRGPNEAELKRLYEAKSYAGMLGVIKDHLRMPVRLRLGLHNNDDVGPKTSVWLERVGEVPLYGTRALEEYRATVFVRRSFIRREPFEVVVLAMAHEISHLVLDAIRHPLKRQEETVDLAAMLLGYRSFYLRHADDEGTRARSMFDAMESLRDLLADLGSKRTSKDSSGVAYRYSYLTFEEIRYAARLMQT